MKVSRVKLLQSMPIFGGITQESLEFLIDRSSIVERQSGEYFVREAENATSMFVLESGKVAVSKKLKGKEQLLKNLSQGDCFGEMALIDLHPRSASIKAMESCKAIKLDYAALLELYQHDLEQFTIIQMNIGREISRRLRIADDTLFEINGESIQINSKNRV